MIKEIKVAIQDFPRLYYPKIRHVITIKTQSIVGLIILFVKTRPAKLKLKPQALANLVLMCHTVSRLKHHSSVKAFLNMNVQGKSQPGFSTAVLPSIDTNNPADSKIAISSHAPSRIGLSGHSDTAVKMASKVSAALLSYYRIIDHNDLTLADMNDLTQQEICYGYIGVTYFRLNRNNNKMLAEINTNTQQEICSIITP